MLDNSPHSYDPEVARLQLRQAMKCLEQTVIDGLNHGFFDCVISSEVVAGGKRKLMIRAGKSHKFTIPEEELPR